MFGQKGSGMYRFVLFVFLGVLVGGCQTTHFFKSEHLRASDQTRRILLMPVDVELSELTASGIPVANAKWTKNAEKHIEEALRKIFGERFSDLVLYERGPQDDDASSTRAQLIKLHGVVGGTAMAHQLGTALRLPSKKDKFDWTLGSSARELKSEYDADYGLFIHVRDSYASEGRVALILTAALFGVTVQGGQQVGYATLVDLENGDIAWFNFLFRGAGDLRTYEPAEKTVQALLTQFPK